MTWAHVGWFVLLSFALLWPCFFMLFNQWPQFTTAGRGPVLWWIVLIFGVVFDLVVNLCMSLPFWEWPHYKRLLLSARMDNLIVNGTGWRRWLAVQIVGRMLQPFDRTGQHHTHGIPI